MISSFRKELRKWSAMLWVVFASMVLASLSVLVFRQPSAREIKVASVNSDPIFLNEYQQAVTLLKTQLDMLAHYARAQGISPEFFLAMAGLKNPEEAAMKELINEKLLLTVAKNISLDVDPSTVNEEVSKMLPAELFDQHGRLNERAYQEYLSRLRLTIPEFETKKENDLKQSLISTLVKESTYVPHAAIREYADNLHVKKRFSILALPFTHFMQEVKKQGAPEAELQELYNETQETYRIPEKRKARYCIVPLSHYLSRVSVDEEAVELFYEKNKSSLYRIPPEVAVRKLTIPIENSASPASIMKAHKQADALYLEAIKNPKEFESFVRKNALVKEEAHNGGFVSMFKRGTHADEFEKEAFKLKELYDISSPVRVENQFEIIQLVGRKPASYTPLEAVREEIVKRLREKKASNNLKSDLEALMHAAKEEPKALEEFIEREKLHALETPFLAVDKHQENELMTLLSKKLFTKKKSSLNHGYFNYKNDCVLFQETDRQKSKIPSFATVKSDVEKSYLNKKSHELQRTIVAELRSGLLQGTITMPEAAKQYNGNIIRTEFHTQNDSSAPISKEEPSLLSKAFVLTDPKQLFKYKGKHAYYLVKLDASAKDGRDVSETEQFNFYEKELEQKKMFTFNAFIASLHRHARIEKYEKTPNYHTVPVTEDLL